VVAAAGAGTAQVKVRTLDTALGDAPVHGIKIDVEGHEMRVIMGAENLLRRAKPWLCVEFNAAYAGTNRLRDWDVHRFLSRLGYSCRLMAELPHESFEENREIQGYCNLFYFHS
jgi:hypothetical protein